MAALEEYERRLPNLEIAWHLKKSDAEIFSLAEKEPMLIALDQKGKSLTSEELSKKLFCDWGSRIAFAIGGPAGLSPAILSKAKFIWSFSPLTFTHQIARLILVEQLYRATEIERKSPYARK